MDRRIWLGSIALASLVLSGCAASPSGSVASPRSEASHSMPDGSVMSGSEHESHESGHQNTDGPSEAAQMICTGQVPEAVAAVLGVEGELTPSSSWDEPVFTCTYELGGRPLILSVHDAADVTQGQEHFADLRRSFGTADDIEGMAALGMPSFSTGDGVVAFLRDGKTLLVDATALPSGLGADGTRTQDQAAYALASAVLVCWVEHD